MLKKLYAKCEWGFALVWIGIYVAVMNVALQVCGGFDDLASKTPLQVLVPTACVVALAIWATVWILRNGLTAKFGLCRFLGKPGKFLWFLPLILLSCINLTNGLALPAKLSVTLLMSVNMAAAGYVEEVLFRGFLFRAMAKDNLKTAILVSAITFGIGHIVNLANTADKLGVVLQVGYAIAIGFLYTVIVYKGGSLWPCILSHMFVNGTSVFGREEGLFSELVALVFGSASPVLPQLCSAVLIIVFSGGYALWLWKKAN